MYTLLRAPHCLHKLLLARILIAESFEVCNYLSIKFAVLRRQRKRKSGEGSVHFADPQSMDHPIWTTKWTTLMDSQMEYLDGLTNKLP